MNFTPRASQILFLLLKSDRLLSVDELAKHLQISKRTIYRELKDINKELKIFGISLENISGKGMCIIGDEEGRNKLLDEISEQDIFDCRNREQRLKRLTLELLKSEEPQKLYYYSQVLQVAEATVKVDLEQSMEWFHEVHMSIKKKPGLGIFLEGEEQNYREACLRYLNENREQNFLERLEKGQRSIVFQLIDRKLIEVIYNILKSMDSSILDSFTEDSKISFLCYLSIAVDRISKGKEIKQLQLLKNIKIDEEIETWLKNILAEIRKSFQIQFSKMEFINLYIYLKGARIQYYNMEQDFENNDYEIQCLLVEMLKCFEPSLQLQMKNDKEFLRALMMLLKPMIVRVRHNIKIENPFLEEIKETYPDVYRKACAAADIIYQTTGMVISQEEIGMLAVHFGRAVLRYEENKAYLRKVEVGVVCSNGIGISRFLASKIRKIFNEKIHVVVLAQNKITEETLNQIDFLISTFKLKNINKQVIEVSPMLTDKDLKQIQESIDYYSMQEKHICPTSEKRQDFLNEITNAVDIGNDVSHILNGYKVCELENTISFEQIIDYASKTLGKGEEEAKLIYQAIIKREQITSQIIPEYQLALLHARTKGIEYPRFILIFPKGDCFIHPSLKQTKVAMVMVIPDTGKDSEALGAVSNAIFEHDEFLEAIIKKEQEQIENYLQFYLKEFLKEQLKKML